MFFGNGGGPLLHRVEVGYLHDYGSAASLLLHDSCWLESVIDFLVVRLKRRPILWQIPTRLRSQRSLPRPTHFPSRILTRIIRRIISLQQQSFLLRLYLQLVNFVLIVLNHLLLLFKAAAALTWGAERVLYATWGIVSEHFFRFNPLLILHLLILFGLFDCDVVEILRV